MGISEITERSLVPNPPANMIHSLTIAFLSFHLQVDLQGAVALAKILFFNQLANDVAKHDMAFLDSWGVI